MTVRTGQRGYRNAVFRARWGEGRDIGDSKVLADCAENAGLSRGEFLEALRKKQYHDEVPKALALCGRASTSTVSITRASRWARAGSGASSPQG